MMIQEFKQGWIRQVIGTMLMIQVIQACEENIEHCLFVCLENKHVHFEQEHNMI